MQSVRQSHLVPDEFGRKTWETTETPDEETIRVSLAIRDVAVNANQLDGDNHLAIQKYLTNYAKLRQTENQCHLRSRSHVKKNDP